MSIAKDIIIEQLEEEGLHPYPVEDVIVKALEEYHKKNLNNWDGAIAYFVVNRIKDFEKKSKQ